MVSPRPVVHPLVEEAYGALGGAWTRPDADQGYPLLHYIAGLIKPMTVIDDVVRDQDDRPGWASVLDVDAAPDEFLDWLGQFVGVQPVRGANATLKRSRIKSRPGLRRGTPDAMIAAARQHLSGARKIRFVERWQGDPYRLLVQTYLNETPYPDRVSNALVSQKPAGILLTYEVVAGASYADLDQEFTTYAAQDAALGTYEEQTLHIPSF